MQSDCAHENGLLVSFLFCLALFFSPNLDRYCLEDVLKVTEMFHRKTYRFSHTLRSASITSGRRSGPTPSVLPSSANLATFLITVEVQRYSKNVEKKQSYFLVVQKLCNTQRCLTEKKETKEKLFFNIYCDFVRMSCELQTEE